MSCSHVILCLCLCIYIFFFPFCQILSLHCVPLCYMVSKKSYYFRLFASDFLFCHCSEIKLLVHPSFQSAALLVQHNTSSNTLKKTGHLSPNVLILVTDYRKGHLGLCAVLPCPCMQQVRKTTTCHPRSSYAKPFLVYHNH